ncbi:cytochrome c peroxidase [Luteitalea sp.]|uniref:cytochrome-c peroxidase n=1 Tax=Luteitalea sp. TaxID=2004800 RepID=UPI0025BE368C|nr:cytochrome c peroxidase [Luteitalea sp.]
MTNRTRTATALVVLILWATLASTAASTRTRWTTAQLEELRSMSITELPPLPPDPTNRVADDPRAADLGRRLFFDTRLSSNGRVACSTCHQPERGFQDGIALAVGVGTTARRTMPIAGMARSPFLFWDGRKDSLWAQALGPLESPVEHGGTRAQYAHLIAAHYRRDYEAVFGPLPDLSAVPGSAGPAGDATAMTAWSTLNETLRDLVTSVFVNIGKAIAAYERHIVFGASRFDRYVAAVTAGHPGDDVLTEDEIAGLRLFIGRANCSQCHNGPLLTNNEFHNTGVPSRPELPLDRGRLTGATTVVGEEFNCRSRWSDARQRCAELDFIVTGAHTLDRAYKVPSLRNVAERAPYMDGGQLATLADVLDHYNRAPAAVTGHSELRALRLKPIELRQLEAFLRTLSGPVLVDGRAAAGATP